MATSDSWVVMGAEVVSAIPMLKHLCLVLSGFASLGILAAESIPFVDLAGQEQRQVVVDREQGQYLGHVTSCLLDDGKTILAVYPKGHGKGPIVYKRSEDGGRTWSERLPTPASWASSKEVPTLHRMRDAEGNERIILWSGLNPARFSVSDDEGESWSELKAAGDWGGIVVMGTHIALNTGAGHYACFFHDDGRFAKAGEVDRSGAMKLFITVTQDGGRSWSKPRVIQKSAKVHLCEPGAIRSPDGKTIALLLRENRRVKNSQVIFSHDEGVTWSEPRELPITLAGDRHTAKYAPDGRLLIVFRGITPGKREFFSSGEAKGPLPTAGDCAAWVGRWEDIVEGRPGEMVVRLLDNKKGYDTTYPGVELLPDGNFVVTTYGHWEEGAAPFIKSIRFRMDELDELAAKASRIELTADGMAVSALNFSRPFGPHMVLPMGTRVPVWGRGDPGAELDLEFSGQIKRVRVGRDGLWKVWLDRMEASSVGKALTVRSDGVEVVCDDVLVGQVWLCSGQSNMDFSLSQALGGREEAMGAGRFPAIRLLDLSGVPTAGRAFDAEERGRLTADRYFEGDWQVVSEASALGFSAVGWWAGKTIHEKTGVPVGLIDNSVGGSGAEAWLPKEVLDSREEYAELLGKQWLESEWIGAWARGRAKLNLGEKTGSNHPYRPGFLFESGVRWWRDFPFAGVLWYQGETNAEIHDDAWNVRLITDLVSGWRMVLRQPDLRWVMVQLPGIGGNDPMRQWWPAFRQVQERAAEALDGVELVVTEDLGWDSSNVHPPDKRPVGERLGERMTK